MTIKKMIKVDLEVMQNISIDRRIVISEYVAEQRYKIDDSIGPHFKFEFKNDEKNDAPQFTELIIQIFDASGVQVKATIYEGLLSEYQSGKRRYKKYTFSKKLKPSIGLYRRVIPGDRIKVIMRSTHLIIPEKSSIILELLKLPEKVNSKEINIENAPIIESLNALPDDQFIRILHNLMVDRVCKWGEEFTKNRNNEKIVKFEIITNILKNMLIQYPREL